MTGLEIVDTAVKVGLGALIGAASGLCLEVYRWRAERKRRDNERYRGNVEKPVIAFVDDLLALTSRSYWDEADRVGGADGVETRREAFLQRLETFREREAAVRARLEVMSDPQLSKIFRDLDSSFWSFRQAVAAGSLSEARDWTQKVCSQAADFIRVVYPRPARGRGCV